MISKLQNEISPLLIIFAPLLFSFLGWITILLTVKKKNDEKQTNDIPKILSFPFKLNDGTPLSYKYRDVNIYVDPTKRPDLNFIKDHLGYLLTFKQEHNSPDDSNVVAIYCGKYKIGYVEAGTMQDMINEYLSNNHVVMGCLNCCNDNYEILMDVCFYKPDTYYLYKSTTFDLIDNTDSEMQESIALCSKDDEIELDYDFEKETHSVIANYEDIGNVPESIETFLDSLEDEYYPQIEEISQNDAGIYVVTVRLNYRN